MNLKSLLLAFGLLTSVVLAPGCAPEEEDVDSEASEIVTSLTLTEIRSTSRSRLPRQPQRAR